jgi:regulator of protease activity HflC (stomatin/prohibitin superfamily)
MTLPDRHEGTEPEGAWAQSAKTAFRFLFLAVCLAAIFWALSGIRQVPPESQAVVYRFGRLVRTHHAGLLLTWPQPIERVVVLPSADRQIEFQIDGFKPGSNPSHSAYRNARENSAILLTGDVSVVQLEATVFYQITDPAAYILAADHVKPALQRVFLASTVSVCAARNLDTILVARPELGAGGDPAARAGREQLRTDVMNAINHRLDELSSLGAGLGITVSRVDLAASIPNGAKDAFDKVLVASQEAERNIAEARTDAAAMALRADQDHDRILTDAEASAAERTTEANARTVAIEALGRRSPGLSGVNLANRIYFDRIGAVLAKAARVDTVDQSGRVNLILPGPGPQ